MNEYYMYISSTTSHDFCKKSFFFWLKRYTILFFFKCLFKKRFTKGLEIDLKGRKR